MKNRFQHIQRIPQSAFLPSPAGPSAQPSPSYHRPTDQPDQTRPTHSPSLSWKTNSPNPDDSKHTAQHQRARRLLCSAIRVPNLQRGAVYRTPHAARPAGHLAPLTVIVIDANRRIVGENSVSINMWCMYEEIQGGGGGASSQQGSMRGRRKKTDEQGRKGGIPHRSLSSLSIAVVPPSNISPSMCCCPS